MFRRNSAEPADSGASTAVPTQPTTDSAAPRSGGKGRPTPSRKEAEAAARERARATKDKKTARKLERDRRAKESRKMRDGIKAGDPRYLPRRDQGPMRAYIRDMVDARVCFAEFLLPLLLIIMFLQYSAQPGLVAFGTGLWSVTLILVLVDSILLRFQLRRRLKQRFPDESYKGTTFYALLRALQVRFLRVPKPRVKLGQRLPH